MIASTVWGELAWAMIARAPVTSAISATLWAATTSLYQGRASSHAAMSLRPSPIRRAVSQSTIWAFSQCTVVGRPRAAARRKASRFSPSSTPGYMPGGATPPVNSLKAATPSSAIASIWSGSSAR